MIIYPAIDLKDGKCVRLYKGDLNQGIIYNEDPGAQGADWARAGFSWIHVVDLNGAVEGKPVNGEAVKAILKSADVPVQLGGGIRDIGQIENWLSEGISRVILGTTAIHNPELIKEACDKFPNQIVVGIDARKGKVAVQGWVEQSDVQSFELVRMLEDVGVSAIIHTDIDRDGTGEGLNMVSTVALAQNTSIPVIASGGVGSLEDLHLVSEAEQFGVEGVVIGKALYDGRLKPADVLKYASEA